VTDWYAPPGTFPPRPPGTPITTIAATEPSPTPAPIADTPALPNPDTAGITPEAVIIALYDAINRGDFLYAYALWARNGAASGQSYAEFVAGYATTDHVMIATKSGSIQGAAGSSYGCVPIVLMAYEKDGSTRSFAGSYLLRRSNVVPGGDPNWRIERASVRVLDHIVVPENEESTELLNTATCQ
jgi:hypothetical protein